MVRSIYPQNNQTKNTPLYRGEIGVVKTYSIWLGKWFLFQTFEELDSIKDKDSEVQQIRQLLDHDQKEEPTC